LVNFSDLKKGNEKDNRHKITVERRDADYMVYLDGNKSKWESDKIPDLAIRKLMVSFKISIPFNLEYVNPNNIGYPIDILKSDQKKA
jgi:hypothetical protein